MRVIMANQKRRYILTNKIIDKFSIENESDLDDEYNPFAYLE